MKNLKQHTIRQEIEENLLKQIKRFIPKTLKGYHTYEQMRQVLISRMDKFLDKRK